MKSITRFFAGAFTELKKVKWPTALQVVRYTTAVIVFLVFFGAFSIAIQSLIAFLIKMVGN